jgi:hypothetical protein
MAAYKSMQAKQYVVQLMELHFLLQDFGKLLIDVPLVFMFSMYMGSR